MYNMAAFHYLADGIGGYVVVSTALNVCVSIIPACWSAIKTAYVLCQFQ